jgi:hypothetical protein
MHRVALMFTDRRLFEIGLSSAGRRTRGSVRSFPWDMVPGFQVTDHVLEVRTWSDTTFRWQLRDPLDPDIEEKLHGRVDLSVSTYQPSEIRSVPREYCPHCSAPRLEASDACSRCGQRWRSPRFAGLLALAFPGAGHLYATRPVAAAARFVFELCVFAALTLGVLSATTPRDGAVLFAVGAIILGVLKIHGMVVARRLASRAGTVSLAAHRKWWAVAVAGFGVSLVALVAPLMLVGQADDDISWDLDFVGAGAEWSGQRVTTSGNLSETRSRWIHRDGFEVWVRAQPLHPFESPSAAGARLRRQLGTNVSTLRLGAHDVLLAIEPATDIGGRRLERYRMAIVDPEGRDLHTLITDVSPERRDQARQALEGLIVRSVWVPTTAPLGGR